MRILLIVSAPTYMSPSPKNKVYMATLKKAGLSTPSFDLEKEAAYTRATGGYAKRSRDLFRGSFRGIIKSAEDARSQGIHVDLLLITARYGLVQEDDFLLPFSSTLTGKPKKFVRDLSERLKTKELVKEHLKSEPELCIVVAKRSDILLVHDPEEGLDLTTNCRRLLVIAAPSVGNQFIGKAEFIGIEHPAERARRLARYLDQLTARTLKDFP